MGGVGGPESAEKVSCIIWMAPNSFGFLPLNLLKLSTRNQIIKPDINEEHKLNFIEFLSTELVKWRHIKMKFKPFK